MLLKITEKIIRRNVFEQKTSKPGLSANQAFEQLLPVEHLLHVLCIYTPDTLWPVSPQITSTSNEPYNNDKPSKPFHNETQFKYRFCCT